MPHQHELFQMIQALFDRVGHLSDHVMESLVASNESRQETNERLSSIEQQLLMGHHRMNDIERKQRARPAGTCVEIKSFLKQVASPQQWAIGALIAFLAMTGIVSPKEIKSYFLGTTEQR